MHNEFAFVREKYAKKDFLLYTGGVGENSGLIVEIDVEENQFVSNIKPLYAVEVNNYWKLSVGCV